MPNNPPNLETQLSLAQSPKTAFFTKLHLPFLLMGLFLISALSRRLNFDEPQALRTGWLLINDIEGFPLIHTPVTMAMGLLSNLLDDPELLFLSARFTISLLTIALMWSLAWSRFRERAGIHLFLILIFTNSPFVTHAMEFRYHWGIFAGSVAGFIFLLLGPSRLARLGVGIAVGWLLTNHVHGGLFAAQVYVVTLADLLIGNRGSRRFGFAYLHMGILLASSIWLAEALLLHGNLDIVIAGLGLFFKIGTNSTKVWPFVALAETVSRDPLWWLLVIYLSLRHLIQVHRSGWQGSRITLITLAFTAGPILFLFAHPHPWPYHMIYLVPFLVALATPELARLMDLYPGRKIFMATAILILCQVVWGGRWFAPTYLDNLTTRWENQVKTLRALKANIKPGDTVLDPSGLAYFIPPSHPDWLTGTLVQEQIKAGLFMKGLAATIPENTTWLLLTYRLQWLPKPAINKLKSNYRHLGGAIALRNSDSRLQKESFAQLPYNHLQNYW